MTPVDYWKVFIQSEFTQTGTSIFYSTDKQIIILCAISLGSNALSSAFPYFLERLDWFLPKKLKMYNGVGAGVNHWCKWLPQSEIVDLHNVRRHEVTGLRLIHNHFSSVWEYFRPHNVVLCKLCKWINSLSQQYQLLCTNGQVKAC